MINAREVLQTPKKTSEIVEKGVNNWFVFFFKVKPQRKDGVNDFFSIILDTEAF